MIQTLLSAFIIIACLSYAARRIYLLLYRQEKSCDGCDGCAYKAKIEEKRCCCEKKQ